jgi:hypothetical protein
VWHRRKQEEALVNTDVEEVPAREERGRREIERAV